MKLPSTYGGSYTRNHSALPALNPECAYFTLGLVSGSVFHSLFDRLTDTAIRFTGSDPDQAHDDDARSLQLTMPVPGKRPGSPDPRLLHPGPRAAVLRCLWMIRISATVPMVWGSWTSCYDDVSEADIVRNTDWIAEPSQALWLPIRSVG